jgi:hypothetical protein
MNEGVGEQGRGRRGLEEKIKKMTLKKILAFLIFLISVLLLAD